MPNRQDMNMVLGQMDELGNTLMKNRVLKQQEQERNDLLGQRERFQQQDVGLRRDAMKEDADWRKAQTTRQDNAATATANYRKDQMAADSLKQAFRATAELTQQIQSNFSEIAKQARAKNEAGEDGNGWARQVVNQVLSEVPPEFSAQVKKGLAVQLSEGFDWAASAGQAQGAGDSTTTRTVFPATLDTTKEEVTTVPGEKRFGIFGADWTAKDIPPTNKTNVVTIPGQPERVLTERVTGRAAKATPGTPGGRTPQTPGGGTPPAVSATYPSEAAARAAGQKSGDVVKLQGIGTVRLK